jgi:hypothetical protein
LTREEEAQIEAVAGTCHRYDASGAHRLARLVRGPIVIVGTDLRKLTLAMLLGSAATRQTIHVIDSWSGKPAELAETPITRQEGITAFLGIQEVIRPWQRRVLVIPQERTRVVWQGPKIGGLVLTSDLGLEAIRTVLRNFVPHLRADARIGWLGYLPGPVGSGPLCQIIEEELLRSGDWWWDDYRGVFLTLQRVSRLQPKVLAHNQRCLSHAREWLQPRDRQFGAA